MWRGLSCVKVAGRRRKSPQKKKKRAQRPTDHRMHLNWFIKAPRSTPLAPSPPRLQPPPREPLSFPRDGQPPTRHRTTLWKPTTHASLFEYPGAPLSASTDDCNHQSAPSYLSRRHRTTSSAVRVKSSMQLLPRPPPSVSKLSPPPRISRKQFFLFFFFSNSSFLLKTIESSPIATNERKSQRYSTRHVVTRKKRRCFVSPLLSEYLIPPVETVTRAFFFSSNLKIAIGRNSNVFAILAMT